MHQIASNSMTFSKACWSHCQIHGISWHLGGDPELKPGEKKVELSSLGWRNAVLWNGASKLSRAACCCDPWWSMFKNDQTCGAQSIVVVLACIFLVEVEERLPRMISKTEAQATCKSWWRCELMPDLWRPMRSTWQHGRNMLKHAETNGPWPMTSIAVWDHSIEVEGDQPCWRAQAIICMKACQGHASSWSLAFWQPISPPEDEDGWIPRAYVAELHSWTSIRANNANAFAFTSRVKETHWTVAMVWGSRAAQEHVEIEAVLMLQYLISTSLAFLCSFWNILVRARSTIMQGRRTASTRWWVSLKQCKLSN